MKILGKEFTHVGLTVLLPNPNHGERGFWVQHNRPVYTPLTKAVLIHGSYHIGFKNMFHISLLYRAPDRTKEVA